MSWSTLIEPIQKVADEDIEVYKVGTIDEQGNFLSLFQNYYYSKGILQPSIQLEPESHYDNFREVTTTDICEGYHSYVAVCPVFGSTKMPSLLSNGYKNIKLGNILIRLYFNEIRYIATFIIPKGAIYYINEDREVVSSCIIYTGHYLQL